MSEGCRTSVLDYVKLWGFREVRVSTSRMAQADGGRTEARGEEFYLREHNVHARMVRWR